MNFLIKNFKLILILLFIVAIGIGYGYLQSSFRQDEKTYVYQNLNDYINPGQNVNQLIQSLGEPINAKQINQYNVYEYDSTSQAQNHQIYTKEENIVFIKEIITLDVPISTSDLFNKYGNPDYQLVKDNQNTGWYLYVYPDKGVAFEGHERGVVLEIWYFQPTDIQTFIKEWAQRYVEDPSSIQSGY